jgi:hypothetical protein
MSDPDASTAAAHAPRPIDLARDKAEEIREQLDIAGAELHLSNTSLERHLPEAQKSRDVRKALEQNAAVEEKVVDAAEQLHTVEELLEEDIAQRRRNP